ncbi:MAG TPA: hypothetical protein VFS43_04545 [Polyangiaceae bacterium]|nr:hypothetical protein [Polyangiaceae bacterium]
MLVSVLATLGRDDEARELGGVVVTLLRKLPDEHPVRVAVERRFGLRA